MSSQDAGTPFDGAATRQDAIHDATSRPGHGRPGHQSTSDGGPVAAPAPAQPSVPSRGKARSRPPPSRPCRRSLDLPDDAPVKPGRAPRPAPRGQQSGWRQCLAVARSRRHVGLRCHGGVRAVPARPGPGGRRPVHGGGAGVRGAAAAAGAAPRLAAQRAPVAAAAAARAAGARPGRRPARLRGLHRGPRRAALAPGGGDHPPGAGRPGHGGAGRLAGLPVVQPTRRGRLRRAHQRVHAGPEVAHRLHRAPVLRPGRPRVLPRLLGHPDGVLHPRPPGGPPAPGWRRRGLGRPLLPAVLAGLRGPGLGPHPRRAAGQRRGARRRSPPHVFVCCVISLLCQCPEGRTQEKTGRAINSGRKAAQVAYSESEVLTRNIEDSMAFL